MAVFRFRLAPVLRYRDRIKKEKLLELSALEEEQVRLTAEINALEVLLLTQQATLQRPNDQLLSGMELRLHGDFAQHVERKIHEQHALLATLHDQIEEKRAEVLQADREAKSLEQLQGRLRERHRLEVNADEQQRADEAGQRKYWDRDS